MKNRNKKVILYTSLLTLSGFAISSLALSCSCNKEKTNTFAVNYINNNFDKNTKTLDLSNTNITHIKSGSFSKEILDLLQRGKESPIKQGTFSGNTFIKKLILPKSLEYIGKSAFEGLGIEEISIPENSKLRLIDESAFNQNKLKALNFPKLDSSVNELLIKDKAFANNLLENVTLNKNIKKLSKLVFANNELESFDFKNIDSIMTGALLNNKIENLTLPETIEKAEYDFITNKDETQKVNLTILNAKLKEKFKKDLEKDPDFFEKYLNLI